MQRWCATQFSHSLQAPMSCKCQVPGVQTWYVHKKVANRTSSEQPRVLSHILWQMDLSDNRLSQFFPLLNKHVPVSSPLKLQFWGYGILGNTPSESQECPSEVSLISLWTFVIGLIVVLRSGPCLSVSGGGRKHCNVLQCDSTDILHFLKEAHVHLTSRIWSCFVYTNRKIFKVFFLAGCEASHRSWQPSAWHWSRCVGLALNCRCCVGHGPEAGGALNKQCRYMKM